MAVWVCGKPERPCAVDRAWRHSCRRCRAPGPSRNHGNRCALSLLRFGTRRKGRWATLSRNRHMRQHSRGHGQQSRLCPRNGCRSRSGCRLRSGHCLRYDHRLKYGHCLRYGHRLSYGRRLCGRASNDCRHRMTNFRASCLNRRRMHFCQRPRMNWTCARKSPHLRCPSTDRPGWRAFRRRSGRRHCRDSVPVISTEPSRFLLRRFPECRTCAVSSLVLRQDACHASRHDAFPRRGSGPLHGDGFPRCIAGGIGLELPGR